MRMIGSKAVGGATRRQLLGGAAVAAGLAGVASVGLFQRDAVAATIKLHQGDIGYQPSPKGNARCELCVNWQAPNACKLVAGQISPSGWCSLYARKS